MIFGIGTGVSGAARAAAYTAVGGINAAAYTAVNLPRQIAEVVLSGVIGAYSIIKQHDIQRDYLRLAQEQVAKAERYLVLAEDNYNNIAVPTFTCQKDLFTRYVNDFSGREAQFLTDAFKFGEFTPDYKLQAGRALGDVASAFGRARQQRRRNTGKYNVGRACHDNTAMAIAEARAGVAATNNAYRYEEQRKFRYDQWYFQRRSAGIQVVDGMASRVVSGINGGSASATSGIGAIGGAIQVGNQAVSNAGDGFVNQANFFGSIAQGAFANAQGVRGDIAAGNAFGSIGLPGGIQTSGPGGFGGPLPQGGGLSATFSDGVVNDGVRGGVGGLSNSFNHGAGHSQQGVNQMMMDFPVFLAEDG